MGRHDLSGPGLIADGHQLPKVRLRENGGYALYALVFRGHDGIPAVCKLIQQSVDMGSGQKWLITDRYQYPIQRRLRLQEPEYSKLQGVAHPLFPIFIDASIGSHVRDDRQVLLSPCAQDRHGMVQIRMEKGLQGTSEQGLVVKLHQLL